MTTARPIPRTWHKTWRTREARFAQISGPEAVAFSLRFRRVSNIYARVVCLAYAGNIRQALGDRDAVVAERVVAWERAQGRAPRDWAATGREERADDPASLSDDDETRRDGTSRDIPL